MFLAHKGHDYIFDMFLAHKGHDYIFDMFLAHKGHDYIFDMFPFCSKMAKSHKKGTS